MSVFALKILAMAAMVCDHLGWFLNCEGLVYGTLYRAMRGFGRLAFPIFAFLIVNGWQHSRDKKAYITRLLLFAAISQPAYVLVFTAANFSAEPGVLSLQLPGAHMMALCLLAGLLWHRFIRPGRSALIMALAPFIGLCTLRLGSIYILRPHMNVFYTLAISLGAMCVADMFSRQRERGRDSYAAAGILVISLLLLGGKVDYGLDGIALLLMLWYFRDSRLQQQLMLTIWAAAHYLPGGGSFYFICAALALVPICAYKGRLGRPLKTVFYLVYPLHLSVLGAILIWQAHL